MSSFRSLTSGASTEMSPLTLYHLRENKKQASSGLLFLGFSEKQLYFLRKLKSKDPLPNSSQGVLCNHETLKLRGFPLLPFKQPQKGHPQEWPHHSYSRNWGITGSGSGTMHIYQTTKVLNILPNKQAWDRTPMWSFAQGSKHLVDNLRA